jgi:hypothetical protein
MAAHRGDADLTSDSFALNYDSGAFMSNYVRSITDDQVCGSAAKHLPRTLI